MLPNSASSYADLSRNISFKLSDHFAVQRKNTLKLDDFLAILSSRATLNLKTECIIVLSIKIETRMSKQLGFVATCGLVTRIS